MGLRGITIEVIAKKVEVAGKADVRGVVNEFWVLGFGGLFMKGREKGCI